MSTLKLTFDKQFVNKLPFHKWFHKHRKRDGQGLCNDSRKPPLPKRVTMGEGFENCRNFVTSSIDNTQESDDIYGRPIYDPLNDLTLGLTALSMSTWLSFKPTLFHIQGSISQSPLFSQSSLLIRFCLFCEQLHTHSNIKKTFYIMSMNKQP